MKKSLVLSLLFIFLSSFAFAGTVNLPKTGQTKCWDTNGIEIPCTGTGQDGEIQGGVAWPEPRFTDNGDGTMTDNLTDLMWTKDGYLPGGPLTWFQALGYVAGMDAGTYANFGYTDWRLPNVNELESLVNSNQAGNSAWLMTQGFTNVKTLYYWSSTSYAYYATGMAWIVGMWTGPVYAGSKYQGGYVWPVRSGQCGSFVDSVICLPQTGQKVSYAPGDDGDLEKGVVWPTPRFADRGNDTVTDNLTGLIWTKDANAPGPGDCDPGTVKTWQQALDYVACLNNSSYLGYTDWRLPNRTELHSLTDYSQYNRALPAGNPFTNLKAGNYWTSTSNSYYTNSAWAVIMTVGYVYDYVKSSSSYYVWPVRGPEPTLNVDIDIRPGDFPNSINLKSKGNVPVAILSSPTFDAATVDRGTVEFAGAPALPIGGSPEDVNSDGLIDMVLHFKTQDFNLQPEDIEACLTGMTFSGQEFKGCDSVRITKQELYL